jgi:oligopeptide transport system permease protein
MEQCPWLLIIPSVVFALTLLSLSYLGDGLRDAFDPRTAKK